MKRIIPILFALLFSISIAHAGYKPKARWIAADIALFGVNISTSADTVQKVMDELNVVVVSSATYSETSSTATYAESVNYNVLVASASYTPAGSGDMEKATYDTGANDIVDNSEALAGYAYTHFLDTATADSTYLKKSEDDSSNYKLTLSSLAVTNRVGIGTASPYSMVQIKAGTSGTVGSHPAGQLIIQHPTDSVVSNVVITAYESDGDGNPDQQLWYLGSASGANSDITFLNRRNAKLTLGTSGNSRITISGTGDVGIGTATPNSKLEVNGTIHSDYGISATTGVFSGQVTSNSRKLIDQYDYAVCVSTPNALSTIATLISPFRSYAVTISTISAQIIGGTNVVFMIEQRTIAGIESAGTDIFSGDVTALPTVWTGGGVSDFTVPVDSALVLVITSVSGNVDRLMIKYRITKD